MFVFVDDGGDVLTSTNGVNWILQRSQSAFPMSSISYGNGMFCASGDSGVVILSTNGVNWQKYTSNLPYFGKVFSGNNLFLLQFNGLIYSSSNGTNWSPHASYHASLATIGGVAFGNNSYVLAGSGGIILQSGQPMPSPALLQISSQTNSLRLTIQGDVARSYRIDWTDNLRFWSSLATISVTNNPCYLDDVIVSKLQSKFYRATALQ